MWRSTSSGPIGYLDLNNKDVVTSEARRTQGFFPWNSLDNVLTKTALVTCTTTIYRQQANSITSHEHMAQHTHGPPGRDPLQDRDMESRRDAWEIL
jgi:hypothetical protein